MTEGQCPSTGQRFRSTRWWNTLRAILAVATIVVLAKFFALAFHVHGNDIPLDHWTSVPAIKTAVLDSPTFMGLMAVLTLVAVIVLEAIYWKIHHLPTHHAAHTGQPKLVFWLSILGIFYNWLWLAAILIVVTDWDKIAAVIGGRPTAPPFADERAGPEPTDPSGTRR